MTRGSDRDVRASYGQSAEDEVVAEGVKGEALRSVRWCREGQAARDRVSDRSMFVAGDGRQLVGRTSATRHWACDERRRKHQKLIPTEADVTTRASRVA
jgi:hypothetical protein